MSEAETLNVDEEFVEIMICPACGAKVRLKEDRSGIKCVACRRVYPIREGIPSMVAEEATVEDEESADRT